MADKDEWPVDSLGMNLLESFKKVPESRIANVIAARSIYETCLRDDKDSSDNRALIKGVLIGDPPFDPKKLAQANLSRKTNINDGTGKRICDELTGKLLTTTVENETLVKVSSTFGSMSQRSDFDTAIATAISENLKNWDDFVPTLEMLARGFIWDGVVVVMWQNNEDWRYEVGGLQDFLFPRRTEPIESKVELMFARRYMFVSELYSKVANKEEAEEVGWNVDNVINTCIQCASKDGSSKLTLEDLNSIRKCNDAKCTTENASICVIHGFIREYDGSITHVIFPQDAVVDNEEDDEGWLYKATNKYDNMSQAITIFNCESGTEGFIHSVRGLGYELFDKLTKKNKLVSAMIDNAEISGSLVLQVENNIDQVNYAVQPMGPFLFVPNGLKIGNTIDTDLDKGLLNGIYYLDAQTDESAGKYSPQSRLHGRERTEAEIQAKLQQQAKLHDVFMFHWYRCLDKFFREIIRRWIANYHGYTDSKGEFVEYTDEERENMDGGSIINDILNDLRDNKIPEAAFWKINVRKTRAVRAVGYNSPGGRVAALQGLIPLRGAFDSVGQQRFDLAIATAYVGPDMARTLIKPNEQPRKSNVAMHQSDYENQLMIHEDGSGKYAQEYDTDNHIVHMENHMNAVMEGYQALQRHEITNADFYNRFNIVIRHMAEHIQHTAATEYNAELISQWNKNMQAFQEGLQNGEKEIMKQQKEQQEQQKADAERNNSQNVELQHQQALLAAKEKTAKMLADIDVEKRRKIADIENNAAIQRGIRRSGSVLDEAISSLE